MWDTVKQILYIVCLFFIWGWLIWLNEEAPHIVEIEGHEYIEEVKWTHRDYQTIRNHSPNCKYCKK